ncbi:MAG: hypothetical protein A3I77_07935 [Gammaproteobacteria bacterium RIFCSPLOWO2_02_FULL_42_14]|nr:MAG: hypothetical protein A3B71_03770 [Gammaproteobacteria bacterium RIFCSPHIGHO2_02_FULL_42_43]OGT27284.1 MAG: hypothetical protein A2624_03025 [Gammaproteobacteria bacterium RIFCSPHIGHO2_01_FULL_42_8]OGT52958.1 MAG: hypothetical protein A3E54_07755 [Gammaproteobacteria bacterium RIFCSPHIGHO2_12_FULL_41_25]OGT61268.1 MAG: hypothetical protein A3I77_07935 [Gammaproteobacteria bacterium RIFCSPLOWO2_02_FULL_42_14]OGT87197.1 MAG: hypothetical protein A3G86_01660 [Gammaproteobacteria bacterium R
MILLTTISTVQIQLAHNLRQHRINKGYTQQGLAVRADVKLATLRKFEQKGLISLESFLKILMVLGLLESVVHATTTEAILFVSIDDVLKENKKSIRKKGWRT